MPGTAAYEREDQAVAVWNHRDQVQPFALSPNLRPGMEVAARIARQMHAMLVAHSDNLEQHLEAEDQSSVDAWLRELDALTPASVEPTEAEHHVKILAEGLGNLLQALGVIRSDEQVSMTGPELLYQVELVADYCRAQAARQSVVATFQQRVDTWVQACFGESIRGDKIERNHRFFEESAEAVQSAGMTRSECHQLVAYVFDRPAGETAQEVGGVLNTLAAFCTAPRHRHERGWRDGTCPRVDEG